MSENQTGMNPEAAQDGRWHRPPPEREKPLRSAWSDGGMPMGGRPITETVEDTIRTAYRVIGENIRQGHDAAERFGWGNTRGATDPSRDLGTLASRMIQLGREMATTYFDAMDLLLQEADQRRGDRERPRGQAGGPPPPDTQRGRDDADEPH